jgi:hypothetical protein
MVNVTSQVQENSKRYHLREIAYILVSTITQSAVISDCSGRLLGILFRDYLDQRNWSKDSLVSGNSLVIQSRQ